jgi:dienelactone hydrolase
MADVLLFHHAHGLTEGVCSFGEALRRAGHVVHLADLYEGRIFASLAEGLAHVREVGFDTILARGRTAAERLPAGLVYVGFSLGVMPAQQLAQTRPGTRAAVFISGCVPAAELGGWPRQLPAQVHAMDGDETFNSEGDLDAARALVSAGTHAHLFLYPGKQHLFCDESLPSFDAQASALVRQRVLALLGELGD